MYFNKYLPEKKWLKKWLWVTGVNFSNDLKIDKEKKHD